MPRRAWPRRSAAFREEGGEIYKVLEGKVARDRRHERTQAMPQAIAGLSRPAVRRGARRRAGAAAHAPGAARRRGRHASAAGASPAACRRSARPSSRRRRARTPGGDRHRRQAGSGDRRFRRHRPATPDGRIRAHFTCWSASCSIGRRARARRSRMRARSAGTRSTKPRRSTFPDALPLMRLALAG